MRNGACAIVAALLVVSSAAAMAPSLVGTYATTISGKQPAFLNGRWRVVLQPHGAYAIERDGVRVVRGRGAVTATEIRFGHETGPAACPGPARYSWSLRGRSLRFTPIEDACAGRRAILTTHPLVKQ